MFALFVLSSCGDWDSSPAPSGLENEKQRAKSFFDGNIKPNLGAGVSGGRSTSSGGRLSMTEDLDWDRAWLRELSFGTALAIPVLYSEELFSPHFTGFRDLLFQHFLRTVLSAGWRHGL